MKNIKGFTLVELLITISIIGILSTISIVYLRQARESAAVAVAKHDNDQIYKAIKLLTNDTGLWPGGLEVGVVSAVPGNEICSSTPACNFDLASTSAGLMATDGNFPNWAGPYMQKNFIDPWGSQYFFDAHYSVKNSDNTPCDGDILNCHDEPVIGSYGPNGVGNQACDSDDVILIIR